MKVESIVRKIDPLGRVVLPIELRNIANIDKGDHLEIFVDQNKIVLKKYKTICAFCESEENIKILNQRGICQACIDELQDMNSRL